ncbi:hypothetical protein H5410_035776 [Solanum commersonii]|uniref:Uncharacterized protein n=1 Tax=Solanum commersonii TaxID=4109 RepID=A0A9J5Y4N8_SOLCO|nr:hypothetical protein H5410_035776 [Solanum commersonii]
MARQIAASLSSLQSAKAHCSLSLSPSTAPASELQAIEEAQHLKKLIQDYIASLIKVEAKNDFHLYVAENLDSSVQLTHELSTQIWKEKVVGGTHKGRVYGLVSRNDVRRIQSSLEGIRSSRQAEAFDGVQIAAMSAQITKLIAALVDLEWIRVAEQESMSETVQQLKEQVMNLARRPTTSAPDDTDDESDDNDYVVPTS